MEDVKIYVFTLTLILLSEILRRDWRITLISSFPWL